MDLLEAVRKTISQHHMLERGDAVIVGVSGGPDSLCLAHALVTLRGELGVELHFAHLDHGIRGEESRADADYVEGLAQEWGIPATVNRDDVPQYAVEHNLAIEEAARRLRYLFLGSVAEKVGATCVAVGHNADDQVETILMHLMRGSGLGGLRGMPHVQVLGAEEWWSGPILKLIRPLLDVPREQIEDYCRQHGLQPRFDRSNLDLTYHRNRIRHELLPRLESFNPRIRQVLRRSARVIADDHDYLRLQGLAAWERLAQETNGAITFPQAEWLELHPSIQRQLLRETIHRLRKSLRDITWTHVEQARVGLERMETGARITLPQGLFLFKGYDDFVIGEAVTVPDVPLLHRERLPLRVPGTTHLPESRWAVQGKIVAREDLPEVALENPNPWQAYLDLERTGVDLHLRSRQKGDRFQPLGMAGRSKSLNSFMIDAKIPQQVRDRWPLVVSPQHIVWVAGHRIDERVKVTGQTDQVLHLQFVEVG